MHDNARYTWRFLNCACVNVAVTKKQQSFANVRLLFIRSIVNEYLNEYQLSK